MAMLQAGAAGGDAAAASRLYRDLQKCANVRRINLTAPNAALHVLNTPPEKMRPGEAKGSQAMLDMIDDELRFAAANAALCAGLGAADIDNVTPAMLRAAQSGDDKAASCYLGTDLSRQHGALDHLEWLLDYKDNALSLANAAVSSGNWTVVKQLAWAYKGTFHGSLLSQVTGTDPAQSYRYLKLWRLGAAPGDDTEYLDTELAEAARRLAPGAQIDADAWAQGTYNRSFSANPRTDARGSINICQRDEL
jgi:hypothetical protein